ncbi:MAG: MBL fold metallo-hydrolase [Nitrospinota bacterium]|nr:MAG: MBL fold metallo-hydrolase [Nitrospinota bacterium]
MLHLCVLGSGSGGNIIYVETESLKLLIDGGLSARQTLKRLTAIGRRIEDIDAILVSHEHTDHIQGVGILARRFMIPVYTNEGTYRQSHLVMGEVPIRRSFVTGKPFHIHDVLFEPFSLSHDAEDPVGFVIRYGQRKVTILTDLGYVTHLVREKARGSHLLVLEFNHDPEMLKACPYPWPIKQRIRSRRGHLSNEEAGRLLKEVVHQELEYVVLAHLSETSNHPDLALLTAQENISPYTPLLSVAKQHEVGTLLSLTG